MATEPASGITGGIDQLRSGLIEVASVIVGQVERAVEARRWKIAWNAEIEAGADRAALERIALDALQDRSRHAGDMFASLRKYRLHPYASPIDDIESFLYLVCFCMDEFYLPWLNDYIKQTSTEQFIENRLQKSERHHLYLYKQMPGPLSQALKYVHRLNERNQLPKNYQRSSNQEGRKQKLDVIKVLENEI